VNDKYPPDGCSVIQLWATAALYIAQFEVVSRVDFDAKYASAPMSFLF